jgi:biopolymer transport protein ExbD
MAFDPGGSKSRVRPAMNVTPLVDVVLVLLIIFMVITPLLTKQFWLHVPKKEEKKEEPPPPDNGPPPVVLAVLPDGTLRVGPEPVSDGELPDKLRRIFAARHEHVLFFGADGAVPFGRAMEVMDLARGGGALTIAVLTEPVPL